MSSSREIVVIGGGTGTYTVLRGLKYHAVSLTAIVTMADDGGSSGRVRDEFGHLPPGDVRRCLVALSSDDSAKMLRNLFEYRFDRGYGLNGHSFGNLFLTALTELVGGTEAAIVEAGRILGVQGVVLPVTLSNSRLFAELEDGTLISGESQIDLRSERLDRRIERVFLSPPVVASPAALAAIGRADAIVIGPGDLYTSVLPNLLVEGVPEAVTRSRGVKILVCNLMTKRGETDGFRASDFVRETQRYLGAVRSLDHVIVNDSSDFPEHLVKRYALGYAFPVQADLERCAQLGPRPHYYPLAAAGTLLRHDSARLASVIVGLVEQHFESRDCGRVAG